MERLPLSVCIIARNEEQRIARCLASVATIAAQIVVVDTGSTDATVERARRAGAEVFSIPWEDDFAAARNPRSIVPASRGYSCSMPTNDL